MKKIFTVRKKLEKPERESTQAGVNFLGTMSIVLEKIFVTENNDYILVGDYKLTEEEKNSIMLDGMTVSKTPEELDNLDNYEDVKTYKITNINFKTWERDNFLNLMGKVYEYDNNNFSFEEKDRIEVRECEENGLLCLSCKKEKMVSYCLLPKEIYNNHLKI